MNGTGGLYEILSRFRFTEWKHFLSKSIEIPVDEHSTLLIGSNWSISSINRRSPILPQCATYRLINDQRLIVIYTSRKWIACTSQWQMFGRGKHSHKQKYKTNLRIHRKCSDSMKDRATFKTHNGVHKCVPKEEWGGVVIHLEKGKWCKCWSNSEIIVHQIIANEIFYNFLSNLLYL